MPKSALLIGSMFTGFSTFFGALITKIQANTLGQAGAVNGETVVWNTTLVMSAIGTTAIFTWFMSGVIRGILSDQKVKAKELKDLQEWKKQKDKDDALLKHDISVLNTLLRSKQATFQVSVPPDESGYAAGGKKI